MIRAVRYTSIWPGGVFWVLATCALLFGAAWLLRENYEFAYHGVTTTATVDQKFMTVSQGRGGKTYSPHLRYHYRADNIEVHCQSNVENETYKSISIGDTFPVLYILGTLTENRIELPAEIRRIKLLTFIALAGTLLIGVGGAFAIRYYVKRNELYRYLRERGMTCNGVVSSVLYDLTGKGQTKSYYLAFTFSDNQGNEREGRTSYLQTGQEIYWQEGSTIHVYFDPANSEKFAVDLNSGR